MGRPAVFVPRPALTLVLAVQPDVIHALSGQRAFRGRGLLARFLYALPHSRVGTRNDDAPPVSDYVRLDYASRVRALLAAPLPEKPADMCLSDGGRRALRAFGRELEPRLLEPRLHPEHGDLAPLGDWAAKLTGAVARIAGVLHGATHALSPSGWSAPIAEETVLGACDLGRYFLAHARAAFGEMHASRAEADARAVIAWLRGRAGTPLVSSRDVQRGLSRRFRNASSTERALAVLEERGYARRIPLPAGQGPGRPRSPIFAIHPDLVPDGDTRKEPLS